jgi:hypothetical protein
VAAKQPPVTLEATGAAAFHWLMRERRFGEAEAFARAMLERHAAPAAVAAHARWLERSGDAAFAAGEAARAGALYRRARAADESRAGALDLKLTDVAFATGDFAAERRLRERIYGALAAEEAAGERP